MHSFDLVHGFIDISDRKCCILSGPPCIDIWEIKCATATVLKRVSNCQCIQVLTSFIGPIIVYPIYIHLYM